MKDYIATFYTVYDAMVFQRILERRMSIPTKLMPVPVSYTHLDVYKRQILYY